MVPDTHYVTTGGVSIAYQVSGSGPIDLVVVPGWLSNIEIFWEEPRVARFFQKLGTFSRVILFDKRGTGLSDRSIEAATLEERMDDVRAVMDAVGSSRAALFGYSEGATMCTLFAATYPSRYRPHNARRLSSSDRRPPTIRGDPTKRNTKSFMKSPLPNGVAQSESKLARHLFQVIRHVVSGGRNSYGSAGPNLQPWRF
jgi:pimeloyl-ACP methyl ester carboxylesterase